VFRTTQLFRQLRRNEFHIIESNRVSLKRKKLTIVMTNLMSVKQFLNNIRILHRLTFLFNFVFIFREPLKEPTTAANSLSADLFSLSVNDFPNQKTTPEPAKQNVTNYSNDLLGLGKEKNVVNRQ